MAKGNKKKKVISLKKDEYDLKSSLNKLKQRENLPSSETSTNFEIKKSESNSLSQSHLNENVNSETATIYFKLNENFNSRYDTLNDNIKTVSDKISDSSQTLRQELEGKIDSKLDTKFYLWTIFALVAITTLIYTLSYSNLVSETKQNTNSVKSFQKDIDNKNDEIESIEKDIEKIKDKQNRLEIEIIKSGK
ncbi:hypothetical protein [Psychroserpens burtonensis]|uniref:hypothetical protein n=1 Tax=Psychroserpens burtonensis TaxID=49278 RepID=UPI0004050C86|nr:hypothetical protein [Psychroserpens burtonensis]